MKKLFGIIAMVLAGSASVQAQELKVYTGAGVGVFGLELKESTLPLNQKNTVFGGYAKAGVELNDIVALELRVGSVGSGDQQYAVNALGVGSPAQKIQQTSDFLISYLARFQYMPAQDMHLYAMLGATTARFKMTVSPFVPGADVTATKTGVSYGLGGAYDLDEHLSVGGEWMQYWTDVSVDPTSKARLWGAVGTVDYHF